MYKIAMLIFSVVFLSLNIGKAQVSSPDVQGIKWQNWSDTVFEQANKEHRLVLVYVKASWCHWCQKMAQTTLQDPAIIYMLNHRYIPVLLDIDKDRAMAIQLKVVGLPTMIVFAPDRRIIKTFTGYSRAEEMLKNLQS